MLRLLAQKCAKEAHPSLSRAYGTNTEARPREKRDLDSQRQFISQIAAKLCLKDPDELTKLSSTNIRENGGTWVLRKYNDSIANLLSALYPQLRVKEEPWRYPEITQRSWIKDISIRRRFLESVAGKLGVSQPRDWLTKSPNDLVPLGGSSIVRSFGDSWHHFLKDTFPEVDWPSTDGANVSSNRQIVEIAIRSLGYSLSDMYTVHLPDLRDQQDLRHLVRHKYHSSISAAMVSTFPEHAWEIHKFQELPSEPSLRGTLLSRFIKDTVAPKLHIRALEDWYRISKYDVSAISGRRFKEFESRRSMCALLQQTFPDHHWEYGKFVGTRAAESASSTIPRRRTTQRLLAATVKATLGDNAEVLEDFLHPTLKIKFDVFVPSKNMAFEYHGEQHFKDLYKVGDTSKSEEWDETKAASCIKAGIRLIQVNPGDHINVENMLALMNTPIQPV